MITACCHPLSPWKQHCCQLCVWWLCGGCAFDWGQEASTRETLDLQVYFLIFLQEEKSYGDMAPSFSQKAPGWDVIQRGPPEQMASVSLSLSGKKRRWGQKHSCLDDNPPGGRRQEEGGNCAILLTQFHGHPSSTSANLLSCLIPKPLSASLRVICHIHPVSPADSVWVLSLSFSLISAPLFTTSCKCPRALYACLSLISPFIPDAWS